MQRTLPTCRRLETLAPRIVHAAHTADLSKARNASTLHSAAHTADLSKARNASTLHSAAHTITVGTIGKANHSGRYPIAFPCLYCDLQQGGAVALCLLYVLGGKSTGVGGGGGEGTRTHGTGGLL